MAAPSLSSHIDEAALVELRRDVAALLARLDGLLAGSGGEAPGRPRFLSLKGAAGLAGRDERTIRRWCARYAIGGKVAGRWQVDRMRLEALLQVL